MSTGEDRKAAGIERVSMGPAAAPWRAVARARLLRLAWAGQPFTSEDITSAVGQPPHPNSVGALINAAARQGLIRRVGFVKAERPNQHAALISSWQGTDKAPEPLPPELMPSINLQPVKPSRHAGHVAGLGGWCLTCSEPMS